MEQPMIAIDLSDEQLSKTHTKTFFTTSGMWFHDLQGKPMWIPENPNNVHWVPKNEGK